MRSIWYLSDEDPGQGDVLELAQITEIIVNGKVLFARPLLSFAQPALRNPYPGFHRRYGTVVGQR